MRAWPPEHTALLIKLHEDGLTTAEIVRQMEDAYTRASVIAKMHRMGIRPNGSHGGVRKPTPKYTQVELPNWLPETLRRDYREITALHDEFVAASRYRELKKELAR